MVSLVQPAEWERHRACITAWPEHAYAWGESLCAAQDEFEVFVRVLCDVGDEEVWLLCPPHSTGRKRLFDLAPRLSFLDVPYGDVWLRDIAPVFVGDGKRAVRFGFNGWGAKYIYPHDAEVAQALCRLLALPSETLPLITEGGALESDGAGTYMATRSCLINDNRNPGIRETDVEALLVEYMGARKVIWLGDGLLNDHTDGHIDNVARFVAPGVVVCMRPVSAEDPNRDVLLAIEASLRASTDAQGRSLTVHTLPSPGAVTDDEGQLLAGSHLNFYIANSAVLVPSYGAASEGEAASVLQSLFPGRKVVFCPASALLTGGGSLHCMTQQVPAGYQTPLRMLTHAGAMP